MTPPVRFEDEADAEYRAAGRWYETRRIGLGLEFFDAVDAALELIARMPRAGAPVPRLPPDLPVRRAPVKRFPYHVVYLETEPQFEFWPWRTTSAGRAIGEPVCKNAGQLSLPSAIGLELLEHCALFVRFDCVRSHGTNLRDGLRR